MMRHKVYQGKVLVVGKQFPPRAAPLAAGIARTQMAQKTEATLKVASLYFHFNCRR
jgi:hypothetical protein